MSQSTRSFKRRKKHLRSEGDGEPEFQVAPMVDVLLVLMLFFMSITTTEILKKEKNLHLPEAKNATKAQKDQKKNEIVVNVTWNDNEKTAGFFYNGKPYAKAADLVGAILNEAQANPNALVLIREDLHVQYGNTSDVMQACAKAGIATVSFAAVTGGEQPKINPK